MFNPYDWKIEMLVPATGEWALRNNKTNQWKLETEFDYEQRQALKKAGVLEN